MGHLNETLLVVDGHADCRETLAMALEFCGYTVCTAATSHEALVWLRDRTPRAVLVDTHLLGGSGLDVARVLRANPRFDRTRILLTGTWFTPEDRACAAAVPVDEVWIKPIDFGELVRQLSLALACTADDSRD
jgi:DNA-binding response OmpR family regulator